MAGRTPHAFETVPAAPVLRIPATARGSEVTPRVLPTGTLVPAGGRLVEAVGQFDAWPLAPVAGRVAGPANVQLTNGRTVAGVEFVPIDPAEAPPEEKLAPLPHQASRAAAIDHLRSAGVWADRTGSPHLISQLNEALHRPIDTVVCSVLDGDPNVPINAAVATLFAEKVIVGVREIARICEAGRAIIVLQQRLLPEVIAMIAKAPGLTAVQVVNDYPQADPTILLASVLKRKLRPGCLPSEAGVLMLDAAAAAAVGNAIIGKPMLNMPMALFDHGTDTARLAAVPIGMPVGELLTKCRLTGAATLIRGGDVLRECRISRDAVVGGAETMLHISPATGVINPDPCIRCGWCVEACPSRIHPAGLLDAAQRRDKNLAEFYGLHACVECGLCDYVCPSRLPILSAIRSMRT